MVPRGTSFGDQSPGRRLRLAVAGGHPVDQGEQAPCPGQPLMVSEPLEERDGAPDPFQDLGFGDLGLRRVLHLKANELPDGLQAGVLDGLGAVDRGGQGAVGPRELTDVHQRVAGVEEQPGTGGILEGEQGGRSLQQAGGSRHVPPSKGPASGRGEIGRPASPHRTNVIVDDAELHPDEVRLLQVVPADLLELGHPAGVLALDPVHEPLVELGSGSLEQAVVGGVPDQDVREPVRVLIGRLPCLGREDQLLVRERMEARRDPLGQGLRDQGLHGCLAEPLPDHGPVLDDGAVVDSQMVEPRGQQGLDGGRHGERAQVGCEAPLPVRISGQDPVVHQHRHHLLHEQGIALRRQDDLALELLVDLRRAEKVLDHLEALVRVERRQRKGQGVRALRGPVRMLLQEVRS